MPRQPRGSTHCRRAQARRPARPATHPGRPHRRMLQPHGRELLGHAGMAWLRALRWPVDQAVLDGEAVAGDGNEGIQDVLVARAIDGEDVMAEPWTARRKRLEAVMAKRLPRVWLVP